MARQLIFFFLALSLIFLVASCRNNKDGDGTYWLDYRVWGDEEEGFVTVRLQYKTGSRNGAALLLEPPANAELDGVELKADSSRMNGIYYEVSKPVKDFAGNHTVLFTDSTGRQYREEFDFQPISFKAELPAVIDRNNIIFELNGLQPTDYVRVLFSDTAAFSEGISRIDTIKNGRLIISKQDLESLASGPVHLEIYKETEKKIKAGSRETGRFSFSYGLKREFELSGKPNL